MEGVIDDGEPSGDIWPTGAGCGARAGLGDVVLVVTRYFGGTKLGIGGLVRAYGGAARDVLAVVPTVLKVARVVVGVEFEYVFFEQVKRVLPDFDAEIVEQDFSDRGCCFSSSPEQKG